MAGSVGDGACTGVAMGVGTGDASAITIGLGGSSFFDTSTQADTSSMRAAAASRCLFVIVSPLMNHLMYPHLLICVI